jgi:Asp-tRNA(Asn)/Glu-tRNA(Gln) amidotransferase A subunit family amidase
VAGIPMMNGTAVLEGFVPLVDATAVTRLPDAGATILRKSVCENLCLSGGSHTADTGPVRNPHDLSRSTRRLVERQWRAGGGARRSIRQSAATRVDRFGSRLLGGIFGLKPTWGLVPYAGAFPIEHYARAQNLARSLTGAYANALREYDLLLMPTLPMKATPLPTSRTREEYFRRAYEMIGNTAQFDVTGHPAMKVPCGESGGLPIGMMLVGRAGKMLRFCELPTRSRSRARVDRVVRFPNPRREAAVRWY